MVNENSGRMWFYPELLKTDALNKIINNSQPSLLKEIKNNIRQMFFDFQDDEIKMTETDICIEFDINKSQKAYINKLITEHFNYQKNLRSIRYIYPKWDNSSQESRKIYIHRTGSFFTFKIADFLTEDELKDLKSIESGSSKPATESPNWDD